MHYYQHHIGDFRAGTSNMKRLEKWLYRDMLDVYYDKERPLPQTPDHVAELIGAETPDEIAAIAKILRIKFISTGEGWTHERCDKEIAAFQARAEVAKSNGKKSAATRYQDGEYMPTTGTLYAFRISQDRVKVGVSANLKSRSHQLRLKYGKHLALIHSVQVSKMGDAEADLLSEYETNRSGEELYVLQNEEVALLSHMDRIAVAYPVASQSHTNHKPLTTNHKPEDKVKTTVEPDGPTSAGKAEAVEVFTYWQQKRGHEKAKLDDKRLKAIKARLKDGYTVGDLCRAVDGIERSPHHMGQNDQRTVYDDIELICRNAVNVDKFVKLANDAGSGMSAAMQNRINSLKEWVDAA